ncbi:hypothetical protein [Streptomyces sp. SYSU K217416]
MAGALFLVAGNGVGHALAQEVPWPLTMGCRNLADGSAGGAAESEVHQDTALSVRVVGSQDIDGQHSIESMPEYSQRAPRSLGTLQSQQLGVVVVAGQSHDTTRTTQLAVGSRPGQGDLNRVVRGHGCGTSGSVRPTLDLG